MAKAQRNKKGQFLKTTKRTTNKRGSNVAKSKSHRRRRFTLPIAVVAGLMPGIANVFGGFQVGGLEGAAQTATVIYTGLDPNTGQWNFNFMGRGTIPILIGVLVHRIASGLGINRAIARAGIPVVRI